jgi:hypothetical protein
LNIIRDIYINNTFSDTGIFDINDITKNIDFKSSLKNRLKDTVFIIFNSTNYASCIYIGNGRFITNKHFFNDYQINEEEIFVRNYKFKNIRCRKEFIPKNNMDLAIIKIYDYDNNKKNQYEKYLKPVKIYPKSPYILQIIYCVTYCYFDKKDIINELIFPTTFKGIIAKKLTKQVENIKYDIVYQVDCSCYSGGSGGPIVDENGYLIGILFQNLSFHTNENFLQLPNSGFIIAKDIISDIISNLNNGKDISQLWMFKLSNEEVDKYLNYNHFNPKF